MEVMNFCNSCAFSHSVGKTLITARIFVSFYMSGNVLIGDSFLAILQ